MDAFSYFLPTKIIFGSGTIKKLPEMLNKDFAGKNRILLVTGRSSLQKAGITDRMLKILEDFTVVLFDKVEANPTSQMVYEGMELFRKHNCDMVIAIGGGSVMDAGKAIAVLLTNSGTLEDYQKGAKMENASKDFIAIPTTAGTSAEMTVWSVITNHEGAYKQTKKSFSSPVMYPKAAIIDPEFTLSLSPYQTACTGLDALSHAIEGCFSKKRNPLSTIYGLEAVKIISENLPVAYQDGKNLRVREAMSFGVMLAGFCFSNSRTTSPHKISYPLTTEYNLPHGAACALTLPYFMNYLGVHEPDLLNGINKAMGCETYQDTVHKIIGLIKQLQLPSTLSELGVEEADIEYLARKTYVPEEKQEDPVPISYNDYINILKSAL